MPKQSHFERMPSSQGKESGHHGNGKKSEEKDINARKERNSHAVEEVYLSMLSKKVWGLLGDKLSKTMEKPLSKTKRMSRNSSWSEASLERQIIWESASCIHRAPSEAACTTPAIVEFSFQRDSWATLRNSISF